MDVDGCLPVFIISTNFTDFNTSKGNIGQKTQSVTKAEDNVGNDPENICIFSCHVFPPQTMSLSGIFIMKSSSKAVSKYGHKNPPEANCLFFVP